MNLAPFTSPEILLLPTVIHKIHSLWFFNLLAYFVCVEVGTTEEAILLWLTQFVLVITTLRILPQFALILVFYACFQI